MYLVPCCNFPCKLLVVDDDKDFLKSINDALLDFYKAFCTSNLFEAKKIITQNKTWVKDLLNGSISRAFSQYSDKFSVEMDMSSLHKTIYDPNRFNNIAILIIDYDMPDMNGLDFIKSLGDHTLKIIMLTGKATPDTVIKAFNQGVIHRYISKGDESYLPTMLEYIEELQRDFFMDFSQFFLESMKTETRIFNNHIFQELFNQIIQENGIVEYYLLDESGSFLLLDAKAENQIWLIIKSKNDMRLFFELSFEDYDTPAYVIKKLKEQEVFTHFKTKKESIRKARDWHLIDCKPLDDAKEFYYAILKNDNDFKIDQSQIKSYVDFLNEI